MIIDITGTVEIQGQHFSYWDVRVKADGVFVPECQSLDTKRMVLTCRKKISGPDVPSDHTHFFEEDALGQPLVEERRARQIELFASHGNGIKGNKLHLFFPGAQPSC